MDFLYIELPNKNCLKDVESIIFGLEYKEKPPIKRIVLRCGAPMYETFYYNIDEINGLYMYVTD